MKPILFNTDMVQALLEGRKSVTRRIVKPQPKSKLAYICMGDGCGKWGYPGKDEWEYWDDESFRLSGDISKDELKRRWTTPCRTDDILYVRETWCSAYDGERYFYLSDKHTDREEKQLLDYNDVKWRPSIHMPREAARIFLRVTTVRVERLQNITPEQARAEGCDGRCNCPSSGSSGSMSCAIRDFSVEKFETVWDGTINPADLDKYGWNANPWVWVIEFERISKEAALEEQKGGAGMPYARRWQLPLSGQTYMSAEGKTSTR